MNILYLCDEYPPGKHGGIGTSVQLLARQMVKLGHAVVVAGLYSPGYKGEDEFSDEGVKVYRFRKKINSTRFDESRSLSSRVTNRLLRYSGNMQRDIRKSLSKYKTELENIISNHQIDIIEMPDYHDYMRFCRSDVAFPKLPVPYVVKMNGSMSYFAKEAGKRPRPHILKMEREILNHAAAVAGVSKYVAEKSSAYFAYKNEVEVIPNGIDTNFSYADDRNPMQVIFTGSLVQKKGIYQLMRAWNFVHAQHPDARLLVLGKGSQKKAKDFLHETVSHSVTFMGHVSSGELYGHLCQSAVSVFPSYAEAFSLAPLEAMACGAAVINSNRTSGPELVEHEVNGLLIDPDKIMELATSIIYLLEDEVRQTELAEKGRESVKTRFDIRHIAEMNVGFYNRVLGRE